MPYPLLVVFSGEIFWIVQVKSKPLDKSMFRSGKCLFERDCWL